MASLSLLTASRSTLVLHGGSPMLCRLCINSLQLEYRMTGIRITVPGCPHKIQDRPAYVHRGFLLDVSRQWYSLPWIKGLVSALAEFKLNVLHLHLTDTASWPLEVDGYPEVARHLAYRDNNGKPLTYSRHDIRQLVEFARVRGMSVMPEIDGPMHAPALASGDPLHLTVAATVEYSTQQFAVEPPPGTWNISDAHALDFVRRTLRQVEEDFSTSPFLHIGGDEPVAASLCTLLPEPETKKCLDQCKVPWTKGCEPVPVKPMGANQTYWFPEVLNAKVQDYFDSVDPAPGQNSKGRLVGSRFGLWCATAMYTSEEQVGAAVVGIPNRCVRPAQVV